MGIIHVLDSGTADQIAAGEVVERPASVVKELVENAIDAGAKNVSVDVVEGGLARIVVADDGHGMDDDDAVLCFSRHATSKLKQAEDLRSIGTFGFRGEALAAISSVAKVRLVTKRAGASRAFSVDVDAGRVTGVGEAAGVNGTRVDVADLFFNVPARKKFLKTLRTEAGHIEVALLSTALARPGLGLRLNVDGKGVLDLPAVPGHDDDDADAAADEAVLAGAARLDRVVRCLGKHVRPLLYPVRGHTELLLLRGHVVAPLETRRDLQGVHLSVNGRPVTDRALVQAVRAAFRTLLEVGRQPIVALDLALDPELVDVNVHPRKAEVRFADPRRVSGHLISLLTQFLATTPWLSHTTPTSTFRLSSASAPASASSARSSESSTETAPDIADLHRLRVKEALARFGSRNDAASLRLASSLPQMKESHPALPEKTFQLSSTPGRGGATTFAALRVVGQVGATYLVLEGPRGMVVIDQHAAHERVVFERLKAARRAQHDGGGAPSQPLLLPITIELAPTERAAIDDDWVRAELSAHGLDVEGFHGATALVRALPPGLDGKKAAAIVRDALAELAAAGPSLALDDRVDAVCARLACHAAVRAGDVLAPVQVRALLEDLDQIDLGAHCPHGRPVVRAVDYGELATWFDRD
jgi:DNA mismatch repair protein MutL